MRHENYKSDLRIAVQLMLGGEPIAVPDHDFMLRFSVAGSYATRKYDCKRIGDVWTSCYEQDGKVICCLDNHKFPAGILNVEYYDFAPAEDFADGNYLKVVPRALDIELITGAGDDAEEIDASVAIDIEGAIADARAATIRANTAADNTNAAIASANEATEAANLAASRAETATVNAQEATAQAEDATIAAQNATNAAQVATQNANIATNDANTATDNANEAVARVVVKLSEADAAIAATNTAIANANVAADKADDAADRAEEYIGSIDIDNYYTKSEINEKFADIISGKSWVVVADLPIRGNSNYIYLVPNGSSGSNAYDEYVWLSFSNKYEKIGSTAIDLSNYYTKAETNALLANKQNTLISGTNIKTINNQSLLGSGNIVIQGGGGEQVQSDWTETDSSNPAYIKNKPTLATVATSGSYNDLTNKPTIPAAQIQSDWSQSDTDAVDYIKNKPTIPAAVSVVDNLTSTSATDALSANQGKTLKGMLDSYCPIIEDTRTSGVVAITGVAPFDALTDGQRIVLHSNYYPSSSAALTLNLTLANGTTTGAKNIKYITTTNTWDNCTSYTTTGKIMSGAYYPLYYDATLDCWKMTQDLTVIYYTMSQGDINTPNTTARVVTSKLLRDNFYLKQEVNNLCPIIEDTRSSAVAAITGVAPFDTLSNGQMILLHLAYKQAQHSTLKLTLSNGNETSAYPIYCRNGSGLSQPTTTYGGLALAGQYILMIYDSTNSRWMNIDSDTEILNMSQGYIDNAGYAQCKITGNLLRTNFYLKGESDSRYSSKRTYVDNSADASVQLAVTTYNDLGTLSTWKTITLPASYDRADEFVFRFTCNDASLTPTLPQGVVMADNFEWSEMAVGVVFQVSIVDGIAAYLVLTPNT